MTAVLREYSNVAVEVKLSVCLKTSSIVTSDVHCSFLGIIVSVMNMLLSRSGRDEQALMITIAGLVVVLMMVVGEIAKLFETVKTVFGI